MAEATSNALTDGERQVLNEWAARLITETCGLNGKATIDFWNDTPVSEYEELNDRIAFGVALRRACETGVLPVGLDLSPIRERLAKHIEQDRALLADAQAMHPEDVEDDQADLDARLELLARIDAGPDSTPASDVIWCSTCGHTLPRGHDHGDGIKDACLICALIYDHRADAERVLALEIMSETASLGDIAVELPESAWTDEAEKRRLAARDRIAWMLGSTGRGWAGNRQDANGGAA